jgi:acyl-CoA reductase-like NAD-dependent aldehyde dehydrogenase
MKKLLLIIISLLVFSLFVLAQETTTTPTTTPESTTTQSTTTTPPTTTPTATPTPPKGKEVDLACMKNAVEKREEALKTARETYFNKISQAYTERKSALLNAWTIENHKERQKKIHEAWNNFRKSVKSAKEEYRKAHNQAWKTFVQDRKNCGSGPTGENPGIDLNF